MAHLRGSDTSSVNILTRPIGPASGAKSGARLTLPAAVSPPSSRRAIVIPIGRRRVCAADGLRRNVITASPRGYTSDGTPRAHTLSSLNAGWCTPRSRTSAGHAGCWLCRLCTRHRRMLPVCYSLLAIPRGRTWDGRVRYAVPCRALPLRRGASGTIGAGCAGEGRPRFHFSDVSSGIPSVARLASPRLASKDFRGKLALGF
jgi:hypothetical protein